MKKGITLYYGYNTPIEERLTTIKKAGFDNIITCADKRFNHQNGSIEKQIKLLQTVGLGVSSLHMQYKQEDLPNFFKKGLSGYILQKNLKKM
jgi:sugar phosphate isomerase/epimerase